MGIGRMTSPYRDVILILLLLLAQKTAAQPFDFRHYQVENGLSNNSVICSLQDSKGFLWFGTKDGLNRFDGYSFKVFRFNPEIDGSLGNNFVHCLYEDDHQQLWVGTESGLYAYKSATEKFIPLEGAPKALVREIHKDTKGNLWFIADLQLYRYNETTIPQIKHFYEKRNFNVTSICFTSDASLWVATTTGILIKYHPTDSSFTSFNLFSHSPKTVSLWIEKIYPTLKNKILIGTSNQGAKLFDPTNSSYSDILTFNKDKTEIFVRNFLQKSENEIWIATETGIFIYDLSKKNYLNLSKNYDDPYALSDNAVYNMCKDKEGGIWVGTYFGGLNYLPKLQIPFRKYFPQTGRNSLSGNIVREIIQDKYGIYWIGTEDGGLNQYNESTGLFKKFLPGTQTNSISYSNIHGLLSQENEIWVGTFEHGLDVLDIRTGKKTRHYSKGNGSGMLKSNFVYCLYQSGTSPILLGTTIGAYSYDRKKDQFNPYPGLPLINWYSSLLIDHFGGLWAGTYGNGVHYIPKNQSSPFNFRYVKGDKGSLLSDRVNSIFEDSRKNIWIATEGGLSVFKREQNQFKTYTTKEGFPSNFFLCVKEDKKGNLWITTSKGLVCFQPNLNKIITFTKENGLLNEQFNFSSAYQNKSGDLFFGTVKGMIRLNPNQLTQNSYTPPIYITDLQIRNESAELGTSGSPLKKSILQTSEVVLENNQSSFSIDFAALSFSSPELLNYAYKMEGLDPNWTILKSNRRAYFTELAPGHYTFRVKAVKNGVIDNKSGAELLITIKPPWWKSTLAYLCYIIVLIICIFYTANQYQLQLKAKAARKMEQLSIRKEQELFEAKMEFFTQIAHEIKTPLTLILGPMETLLKKSDSLKGHEAALRIMGRNTNRLLQLSNQLLDFRQTEINAYHLQTSLTNVNEKVQELLLEFVVLAEKNKLNLQTKITKKVIETMLDTDAFEKIFTNLLGNAVKYAHSCIQVELGISELQQHHFFLEIRNDGFLIPEEYREKIFTAFFRLKETEKSKGTGIGLALAKSLTELHKGTLMLLPSKNEMNIFRLEIPLHPFENSTF